MARSAPKTLLLSQQVLNAVISLPECPDTQPSLCRLCFYPGFGSCQNLTYILEATAPLGQS